MRVFVLLLLIALTSCSQEKPGNRVVLDLMPDLENADLLVETKTIAASEMQMLPSGRMSASFYSFGNADKTMKVRCKSKADQSGAVLVPILNGHRLKPRKLSSGFEEYPYSLAPFIQSGWNELQFLARSQGNHQEKPEIVFDSVILGEGSKGSEGYGIRKDGTRIVAPVPSRIDSYFRIPGNARLEMRFGLADSSRRGSAAQFTIYAEDVNRQRKRVASQTLIKGMVFSATSSESVSLAPYENKILRLSLEVSAVAGKGEPEQIYWQDLQLTLPEHSSTHREQATVRFEKKPNIFLYLIDALRGDHLQTYGYSKATSPEILEFSGNAVVFENVYAQSAWTRSSVASIVTGLYPSVHLTIDRVDVLDESLPTLQALLKASGYHNYGLVAQPNVSGIFHFEKSFDVYRLIKKTRGRYGHSDQLLEQVRTAFEQDFQTPAFVYIHAIDTHRPYIPLPRFAGSFGNCTEETVLGSEKAEDVECARNVYDALILQSDSYFGEFVDLLKAHNLWENSIVILTADHGESFMEHGVLGHGKSLYEHEIRVPLIIHFPGNRFAGKRISQRVRHIDILPTFVETLSLKKPAGLEGASLLGLLEKNSDRERPVFSELGLDGQDVRCVILDHFKLISTLTEDGGRLYELYDLTADPSESKNLAVSEPVLFGYMKRILNEWSRTQKKKAASRKAEKAVLDKETEEMLKGLGYLQ